MRTSGAARSRRGRSRTPGTSLWEDVWDWTKSVEEAPDEPGYVDIGFRHGVPVSLDGEELDPVTLILRMHALAAEHGVGRIDMVENRLVGIKSREVYEAPAATALMEAHRALETITLGKQQLRLKHRLMQDYADLIYDGLWFTAHHQDLASFTRSMQRHVSGDVRLRLHKGRATVVGRRSPNSLYQLSLATYDEGDMYDVSAAPGFIQIWGLPVRVPGGRPAAQAAGGDRWTSPPPAERMTRAPATRAPADSAR